ncbi:MAG: PAS domain S-box protein [Halieaceae bacterium]|jgi:PAS domain S-box-containing protein|nr:PAS domain S-box protein [Halieaceae bacterium]
MTLSKTIDIDPIIVPLATLKRSYFTLLKSYFEHRHPPTLKKIYELGEVFAVKGVSLSAVADCFEYGCEHVSKAFSEVKAADAIKSLSAAQTQLLAGFEMASGGVVGADTRAEDKVLSQHQLLNTIFEVTPTSMIVINRDGTISDYRVRSQDDLHGLPEDFLGQPMVNILAQQERLAFQACFDRVKKEGGPVRLETSVRIPTGPRYFEAHLYELSRGGRIILLAQDITERKQAEMAIMSSEKLLANAERIASIGSWTFDLETGKSVWSREMFKIAGAEGQEPTMDFILSTLHPDDVQKYEKALIANGERFSDLECRLIRPDGGVRYLHNRREHFYNANGKEIHRVGTTQDITQRVEAEDERRRLMSAVDHAGESIVITNAEGVVEYANPAFERMTGFPLDKVKGQKYAYERSDEQDDELHKDVISTLFGGESWSGQRVNKKKDGSHYTESQVVSPVFNSAGKITNFVSVIRDVTEQIGLEEQLRQAQKMESVGQLAGGVAHDFNNMLSVITGYAELALSQLNQGDASFHELEEIHKAALRSAAITKQLLTFARKQTIDPKVMDVNDAVSNMLKMLRRLIGEDIELVWIPGAENGSALVDPSQVDQLLTNLCVNARDAIGGAGRITIESGCVDLSAAFCSGHQDLVPGEYIRLSTSDDGSGMSRAVLQRIYDPFFTTKSAGRGTGLGLSTVYGIVKQNKGLIQVDSELGKGTRFDIYFPRHSNIEEVMQETPFAQSSRKNSETIIFVEDEEALLSMSTAMLENLGYTVIATSKPEEAVALFDAHSKEISLLVTDVVMPGMNGYELSVRLQELKPDLRSLFISGYPADVITRKGVLDEGINFLQKPFSVRDIAGKIRDILD